MVLQKKENVNRRIGIHMLQLLLRERLGRYLVVGVFNTVAGNAIFWMVWNLAGETIGFRASCIASFLLSVLVSFSTQARIVFRVTGQWVSRLMKFYLSQSFNLLLFFCSLEILKGVLGLGPYSSYFAGSVLIIVVGFVVSSRLVFSMD